VLGVTEIARRVGLHKSTVSCALATLEQAGLVERDAKRGRFQLGIGVIGLAGPLLANLDVRRVARSALEA
jgi:DNA-binding IclR family transcriptional regulator